MARAGIAWTLILLMSVNAFGRPKVVVAVLDLSGEGISATEARIISSRLRTELFETNEFVVVERENMDAVLREQGFQLTDCTSDECALRAGKLLGTDQIIVGEIGKIGTLYTLSIRLIDVETGRLVDAATEDCECRIETVLKESTRRAAMGLAKGDSHPTPQIDDVARAPNEASVSDRSEASHLAPSAQSPEIATTSADKELEPPSMQLDSGKQKKTGLGVVLAGVGLTGVIAYQSASSGSEERSDSEKTQHLILLAGSVASLVVGFFLLRP